MYNLIEAKKEIEKNVLLPDSIYLSIPLLHYIGLDRVYITKDVSEYYNPSKKLHYVRKTSSNVKVYKGKHKQRIGIKLFDREEDDLSDRKRYVIEYRQPGSIVKSHEKALYLSDDSEFGVVASGYKKQELKICITRRKLLTALEECSENDFEKLNRAKIRSGIAQLSYKSTGNSIRENII